MENVDRICIYCVDVGSVPKGNFGWFAGRGSGELIGEGRDMDSLVTSIVDMVKEECKIALGFESPLFIPARDEPRSLLSPRNGETYFPWSAKAGPAVLCTGLVQTLWIFQALKHEAPKLADVFFDWSGFVSAQAPALLVWEAFVAGRDKTESHIGDARSAASAFRRKWILGEQRKSSIKEEKVFSLAAASLLRAGWPIPLEMLGQSCIVVKPG